jgi:hypothetical protein
MNEETIASVVGWGKTLGCIASSITVNLPEPGLVHRGAAKHGARHTVFRAGGSIIRFCTVNPYFMFTYIIKQPNDIYTQPVNGIGLSEPLGPTAVVVKSEATYRQVSDFKAMTAMTRPLQIFDERDVAYAWLTTNPWDPSSAFAEVPKGRTEQGQREDTRD